MIKNENIIIDLDLEGTNITAAELEDVKYYISDLLDYGDFISNKDKMGLRTDIINLLDFMNKDKVISNMVVENINFTIYFVD